MSSLDIRPSPISGRWYPQDPQQLTAQLDAYMPSPAEVQIDPAEIIALVAPHAGYVYSGPVAGRAFALVRGQRPGLVIVLSPMHHPHRQALLTSGHQAYGTPLGTIPIDQAAVTALDARLQKKLGVELTSIRDDDEHSLEIELPFLQRALASEFALLPVMVREQTPRVARALGESLAEIAAERRALLVASTDLSHFYPQEVANTLDAVILEQIAALNPAGVFEAEEQRKGFACGRGAVAAVLWAAKQLGADTAKILKYATSGDVSGDFTRVVGYGAAVIARSASQKV